LIEPVKVHFEWRPQSRDPHDEMVIAAALNGRADALVTFTVKDFAGPIIQEISRCCWRPE
jgi:predicted nucleic acid-binding protein